MEHVLTPYKVSTEYLFPISYNRKIPKVPKYVDLRSPKVKGDLSPRHQKSTQRPEQHSSSGSSSSVYSIFGSDFLIITVVLEMSAVTLNRTLLTKIFYDAFSQLNFN